MRQSTLALIIVFALFGNRGWAQAGAPAQTAPAAKSAQQKQDQSECMKWAKQQAGLSESSSSQQPSSTGTGDNAGAAPDKSAATQPPDNSSQSNPTSGLPGAVGGVPGMGGAANSKVSQLVKDAYTNCMQKKGYKTK